MTQDKALEFLGLAEKLKCTVRHSWTSSGRRESVAEHVFRLMVFAWLVKDEFPECDPYRVMELALFHDMGEAVTGDIPAFEKTKEDRKKEEDTYELIADLLPEPEKSRLGEIFRELSEGKTPEARLVKAMDKLEAVIQHNEADISTWLPLEYELQLTYGKEQADGILWMKKMRERVCKDALEKIEREGKDKDE
ncbi:HD domain-containing protein [Merdimonas faecis]|uniref:HD domain-containing protein n=1 Tax=Merdimonas faecis TaxID=1653435 RepID=UPI003023C70D|nr:HD domain-containing protein [Lachnospiraceae bacterium]